MASITTRPSGHRWILFTHPRDGRRRTLRLGKLSRRDAEAVTGHVERIVGALSTGAELPESSASWLRALPDATLDKLARVNLCDPPTAAAPRTLAGVLDAVLDAKRDDLKPEAVRKLRQTRDKLCARFGDDADPRTIDADGAARWRAWLVESGLSRAAVRTHCGNVRTLWHAASRRGLVPTYDAAEDGRGGPFATLDSGPTARRNIRYVTPGDAAKVIAELPDGEWRLLFGLAYWAGLRTPSETHGLTWRDVDFDKARLHVSSPKTERYAGHERRLVPIVPELMGLLRDRFDAAAEGETHLITLSHHDKRRVYRVVAEAVERANVEPWPALWQTLRDSCERRWAMAHPQFAVSRWIGHSITVSGKHYANVVPDELFTRAAESPAVKPEAELSVSTKGEAKGEALCVRTHPHPTTRPAFTGSKSGSVGVCEGVGSGGGGNRTPVS